MNHNPSPDSRLNREDAELAEAINEQIYRIDCQMEKEENPVRLSQLRRDRDDCEEAWLSLLLRIYMQKG